MSRTAEEQLLLEERIQAMKRKNEELRRRHMEVEADKQSAAKQNALVKMNVPHDDDWVPGRVVDNPRQDRPQQHNEPSSPSAQDRNGERSQWPDQRRSRHFEEGSTQPKQTFSGRRGDYQGNRQRSDGDWSSGHDNRRSNDGGGRTREWGNRGYRNSGPSGSGDGAKGYPTTFTSKVFKNSSMDPDRGKRPGYRLAEGDGPPPDPSYSFLGDSMRDSPESGERRRGNPRRGFPRSRGRGGQPWNNRGFNQEPTNGDFEDRAETQPRNHDDSKQDEWRRERSKIDQERINRQKTSDGSWSREWDNNKVLQEGGDRPHRWRRGNQNQNYVQSQPRRGYDNSYNNSKQSFVPRADASAVGDRAEDAQTPLRPPLGRRGRFTHQQRFKENNRFSNGSSQQAPSEHQETSGASDVEFNATPVEKLQVSLVCDASGAQMTRSVESQGGNLRISVSKDEESSDDKTVEQKRHHKRVKKSKRNRVFSSTSTGTTGTAEGDNESWEDLSSEEEAVSILTELEKVPRSDTAKCIDVSSGPDSLDPVPAPGKEDEFLWDDFHPAGFQDNENVTLHLTAEAAYQALLDEKAKQAAAGENGQDGDSNISTEPPKVSFRLDTACLDDSSDELEGVKLDPLLITTQIVQAEVDCMSLTSLPTDTSLSEDISQFIKNTREEDGFKISEVEEKVSSEGVINSMDNNLSAEELSGPVSTQDVPQKELSSSTKLFVASELKVEEAGRVENVLGKSEQVPESEALSSADSEAMDQLKMTDLKNLTETTEDKESEESLDSKQELEKNEDLKDTTEKKEHDNVDFKLSIETSTNTVSQQSLKIETEDCVIEAPAQVNNVKNMSENRSNTVFDSTKNGDAIDVTEESPSASDGTSLPKAHEDGPKSADGTTSMNSSEKATDQEGGDNVLRNKDSVCGELVDS